MTSVLVLGGCGGIGSVAVRALSLVSTFDRIVVGDVRLPEAERLASSLGRPGVEARKVDARSHDGLVAAMRDVDLVLSCAGPFFEFGPPVLRAAIDARRNYVDVCDNLAPTRTMLELDADAKRAGITALLGMGNSPGLANVFVRLCRELFFDAIESVDIFHIHGGEPEEGAAVIKHRIFAMRNDVPLFLDGELVSVRQLEPSGKAHVQDVDFRGLGSYPVYPYPHPETITLPQHVPGLRRATNMGVIFPLPYFQLTQKMVEVGACTEEPLDVKGQSVVPIEFSVAHILSQRARFLAEAGVTGPAGALKVVVGGVKGGAPLTFVLELSSRSAGAGEGTGIPAAAGALWMAQRAPREHGVFPPEALVPPLELLPIALDLGKRMGVGGGDSIHIESIDARGNRTPIPLPA